MVREQENAVKGKSGVNSYKHVQTLKNHLPRNTDYQANNCFAVLEFSIDQ